MNKTNQAKLSLIISMIIFGSIGLFRKYIDLPSEIISMVRGFIGAISLLFYIRITKKQIVWKSICENIFYLTLSGVFLGLNWVLLFEAYQYASVATATLCYYMAPVLVILISVFFMNEKLSLKKWACVIFALLGIIFVSGVLDSSFTTIYKFKGIFFGLAAAGLYASVILLNKKIMDISAYDRTFMQLLISAFVLFPYNLFTTEICQFTVTYETVFLLLLVGILHTGVTYVLYFDAIPKLKMQTVAIFSYIDPIVAIFFSTILLHEKTSTLSMIGAILILGSMIISELSD